MADIWIPGYTRIRLGPSGGVYDELSHPKGCMHTTEGNSILGAESAYREYPPHIGYDPRTRIKHQYVPLNRHSYALKGNESDDEYLIQVEIVGYASYSHKWSDQIYRNLASDVIAPLEDLVGIPRKAMKFYGEMDGIVLATKNSPIRLSPNGLRAYSGWVGHQHIPSPDNHWDPGKLLIQKSFDYLEGNEDDMSAVAEKQIADLHGWYRKGITSVHSIGEFANYIVDTVIRVRRMEPILKALAANQGIDIDEIVAEIVASQQDMLEQIVREIIPREQADAIVDALVQRLEGTNSTEVVDS